MPDGSPYSLKSRLLLSATAVLLCFLGLMGLVLDQAFQRSAEQGVREARVVDAPRNAPPPSWTPAHEP